MNDLTQQRLITNALWTELKRDRWRGPTSTRDLDEHGCKPPYRTVASGRIPNTPKRDSQHRQTDGSVLIGRIPPDPRANPTEQLVMLHRATYDLIHNDAPEAAKEELALAIHNQAGPPYAWHKNGRGEHHLERRWDAWMPDLALKFLNKLAEAATLLTEAEPRQVNPHETPMGTHYRQTLCKT